MAGICLESRRIPPVGRLACLPMGRMLGIGLKTKFYGLCLGSSWPWPWAIGLADGLGELTLAVCTDCILHSF